MSEDSEEEQSNSSFRPQATPPLNVTNEEKTLKFIRNLCQKSLSNYKTSLNVIYTLIFIYNKSFLIHEGRH